MEKGGRVIVNSSKTTNGTSVRQDDPYALLNSFTKLIQELDILQPPRDSKVVKFYHPHALQKKLDLELKACETDDDELRDLCREIMDVSVHTNHPNFYNQLYNGTDLYGFIGALITEALNTNQLTWELAPAFTLIENAVYDRMLKLFQIPNGEGLFSPGGSLSNMYGMILARHRIAPEAKQKGISCIKPMVVFTSADSHFSIKKGVNWLGIGTDNMVKVACDNRGRMIPAELEKRIQEIVAADKIPLFVNATAGTTVIGAFDPFNEIADICRRHNVWMHVDACWGGSLILSSKYKKVLSGVEKADSVSWNPHKMIGAPLQCALFLTKHKGLLLECNSAAASYLFQPDKFYDVSYDTGDKSLQCGRKVDALKLWMIWRARGDNGLEKLIDRAMENIDYFRNQVRVRDGFRLVLDDADALNVCFWFFPKRLRGKSETEQWWDDIDKIAPKIKETLTLDGSVLIGYQPIKERGHKNFFRLALTVHPYRTHADMDFVLDTIESAGQDL